MQALTIRAMTKELEEVWDALHDAKPDGWFVGTPVYIERRGWEQYAFDTRERHKHGRRRGSGRPSRSPSSRRFARWRGACD